MREALMAMLVLGACARGGIGVADDEPGTDAKIPKDAAIDARPDARPDAPPDAPPDACIPVTTQLLQNPVFDLTPMGMGWTEQLIQSGYPLITAQDGVPEHTAPYKAWLGGFTGNGVTDVLYQDVAIPPLTTQLVLTGYYDVRTNESSGSTVYDSASMSLTQTNGTPIVTMLSMSNLTPRSAWTLFTHTFAQNLSGQTVRLRLTSSNDTSYTSSFYFDTFSLMATHGCP
jgi:hypothetical protein